MRYNSGRGHRTRFLYNTANAEEINIELGGGGPESELVGGAQLNLIPKNRRETRFSRPTCLELHDHKPAKRQPDGRRSAPAASTSVIPSGGSGTFGSFGGPVRRTSCGSRAIPLVGRANTMPGDYENARRLLVLHARTRTGRRCSG